MERAELSEFVASLGCGEQRGGHVFLRDPHWSAADCDAAERQWLQADRLPPPAEGWLGVRTGGSTGGVKFARHDERTLDAAVQGFCRHFDLRTVNSVNLLPPWHISGFMARLRAARTGGACLDTDWKAVESGRWPELTSSDWVISLVPTQLARLLASPLAVDWLRRFALIFLGGGPVRPEVAERAAAAALRVSQSYGMTETAAMVVAQQPEAFLAGDRSSGMPLPHAELTVDATGRLVVRSDALFRGYFPDERAAGPFVTQDLGRIDEHGRVHVLGRADAVIITGGKKVFGPHVEASLLASGEFEDVAVLGVPDGEWGERVVAFYPASARAPDLVRACAALAAHERPKEFRAVSPWPRTTLGKLERSKLLG